MQEVRPQNRVEFMNKLVMPYDTEYGNPNIVPSEPFKPGQPEFNRAFEVSMTGDPKKFSVGIKDIDEAIMFYFEKVLKLSVYQNNNQVPVPTIYGSPEKWVSVQRDGYYRDGVSSKIMSPLIMFKRKSIQQNRALGNKLDGNKVHNVQLFKKAYSRRNVYDDFHVLQNQKLQDEYIVTITPDYVTISYDCIIWTNFMEQMDKLIEAINFASNSYWGDVSKFQFLTRIDSFEDNLVYETGEDRLVRTNFSMNLNGYLIPDTVNAYLAQLSSKTYNLCKIVFNVETIL